MLLKTIFLNKVFTKHLSFNSKTMQLLTYSNGYTYLIWIYKHSKISMELARTIGVILRVDYSTLSGDFGHFSQVLVDINLFRHLPQPFMLSICEFVSIAYKTLLEFCWFVIFWVMMLLSVGHYESKVNLRTKRILDIILEEGHTQGRRIEQMSLLKQCWVHLREKCTK